MSEHNNLLDDLPVTAEEEQEIVAQQRAREGNKALYCAFCGEPKSAHWVYDKDGKLKRDEYNTIFRRRCAEEVEHNLSYYYDDVIVKPSVAPRPKKTPLSDLFTVDMEKKRGFISNAFIAANSKLYPNPETTAFHALAPHLKAFIKHLVLEKNVKKFRYIFLDLTELREIKFGNNDEKKAFSYSSLDEIPLIIFDLAKEAHDNRADENNLTELIVHRESRNKALWFLSPTVEIRNRHINDAELCKKIKAYSLVDIRESRGGADDSGGSTPGDAGNSKPTSGGSADFYVPQPTKKRKGSTHADNARNYEIR